MNLKLIMNKAGLVIREASPELLTGGGIILGIAALITACSKMKKAEEAHEELQNEAEELRENAEMMTKKEAFFSGVKLGLKTVWRYLKVFWIPILLELMSITAIWYSHGIMVKRNADLASAAVILTQQIDKYRARVREKIGAEAENDLFYNIQNRKIGEVTEVLENGKTKKRPLYEKVVGEGAEGPFDFVFDRTNHNFQSTPGNNMIILSQIRKSAQDIMESRATSHSDGYYMMNELLRDLGREPTAESFRWGFWYSKNDPKKRDYIDFGLNDCSDSVVRDFMNGTEPAVPLHFNCHPLNPMKDLNLLKI